MASCQTSPHLQLQSPFLGSRHTHQPMKFHDAAPVRPKSETPLSTTLTNSTERVVGHRQGCPHLSCIPTKTLSKLASNEWPHECQGMSACEDSLSGYNVNTSQPDNIHIKQLMSTGAQVHLHKSCRVSCRLHKDWLSNIVCSNATRIC